MIYNDTLPQILYEERLREAKKGYLGVKVLRARRRQQGRHPVARTWSLLRWLRA